MQPPYVGVAALVLRVTGTARRIGADAVPSVQAPARIDVVLYPGVAVEAQPALGRLVAGFVAASAVDVLGLVILGQFSRTDQVK